MTWISFNIKENQNCKENVTEGSNKYLFQYPCTSLTTCEPYTVELQRGYYLFELWGAQGGDGRYMNEQIFRENSGGKGAFVSGMITIKQKTKFYLYIGGKGENQNSIYKGDYSFGGFNGGGNGGIDMNDPGDSNPPESGAGGGGSTDIRLIDESDDKLNSLKSRIIVAGAGGGSVSGVNDEFVKCKYDKDLAEKTDFLCSNSNKVIKGSEYAGAAGTLYGYRTCTLTYSGNQTNGLFGYGMNGLSFNTGLGGCIGGGGSGYFGGNSANLDNSSLLVCSGAGGSSYVSGCNGCRSVIDSDTVETIETMETIETSDNNIHYSKYKFESIKMFSGLENFFSPSGSIETGHSGSGAISITYFPLKAITCNKRSILINYFYLALLSQLISS